MYPNTSNINDLVNSKLPINAMLSWPGFILSQASISKYMASVNIEPALHNYTIRFSNLQNHWVNLTEPNYHHNTCLRPKQVRNFFIVSNREMSGRKEQLKEEGEDQFMSHGSAQRQALFQYSKSLVLC